MAVERIPIISREQWLAIRKSDVTASVVAALFGAHPYKSELKLHLAQRGVEFEDEADSKVMRRGRLLEPSVALAVGEMRPDWRIEKCTSYFRDPELRLGATPDFFIHGDPRGLGVLEAKTARPAVFEREWDDQPPFWIQLQVLTQAMLTEAAFGMVAVVHSFEFDCDIYEVARHPGAEQRIVTAVRKFWEDVAAGHEPDPDYGKDAELLRAIAPREVVGKTIDLSTSNELPALLEQREELAKNITAYEKRKDEIETEIKFKMRDAERIVGVPEWSISWRTAHRAPYTVPAKDIRTLRIYHHTMK